MKKVLFVCLGNICRSPAAEGILVSMAAQAGLSQLIDIDSAGTSAHHEGEPADSRMQSFAKQRGYNLTSKSRPFRAPEDFKNFDYIVAMDGRNLQDLVDLDSNSEFAHKILPMTQFCKVHNVLIVPDPYYKGDEGFNLVLDILEDACENFLHYIQTELGEKK